MYISLDTNVFISVSKGEFDCKECELILSAIAKRKWKCGVSIIVLIELLVGAYKDKKPEEAELLERKFGEFYEIQQLDKDVIHLGTKFRAETGLKLPDALIVGSAISHKVNYLISRDIEINSKIPLCVITPQDFVNKFLGKEQ